MKSVRFKFITDAPHGFKLPFIGNTFKLFPQALYVDIDGTGIAVVIEPPYCFG